jgi:hypothetical protein
MPPIESTDRDRVQLPGPTVNNRHIWILTAIVVYAAAFRGLALNRPFDYDAEGSGSLNAVLARSYLRFDWSQSHGMPILSLDRDRAPSIVFYPDHPPLVPLLILPFYKIFSVGEWQTRLPVTLTTIGAILLLYRLLANVDTPRVAIVAAAVFAATPMTLYFGGFADVVGLPLLFAALIAVDRYLHFYREPRMSTFAQLAAGFAVAGLCDWPAYVLAPVFAAHFVATRPRHDWRWAAAFVLFAAALFAAVYAYITLATGNSWTWMADLFARRSALVGSRGYTGQQWMANAVRVNARYHTWPLLIALAAWILWFAFRRPTPAAATVAKLLLAWAVIYGLIGSKALFDHEWAWSVATPAFAVAAALLLTRLPSSLIACGLVAFAAWTTHAAFVGLYPRQRDRPFTPTQMAEAVRLAAPEPRDVALLVGNENEAQLWFYADRPIRSGIWTIDDFARRLNDETVDLMFNFDQQPWAARATGLVFPKIWAARFPGLYEYLERQYRPVPMPAQLAQVFDVFDLRVSE